MNYRSMGRLDWQPSALGFGCMRLARLADGSNQIDQEETNRIIRHAIDSGVNYVDTAYIYSGSEEAVGIALDGGYREKVKIATKLPLWGLDDVSDADRILEKQLVRLKTDHIDFYLFHALDDRIWPRLKSLDLARWAERKMADGLIRHLGFSFHGSTETLKQIVDWYDNWAMCMIQYNFLDQDIQAGTAGLHYAHDHGLAVAIMEPLRGGLLATPPSDDIRQLVAGAPADRSSAEWALQWLWNKPEVSVVLSGMNTMEQVVDNLQAANRSGVGILTPEEDAFLERLTVAYKSRLVIPCTSCGYCLTACPNGVDIAEQFLIYNAACMYLPDRSAIEKRARSFAGWDQKGRPDTCTGCGACEAKCPQHLPIRQYIQQILKDYGVNTSAAQ